MALHESSVNFKNLIRDLAEMYTFDITEVVVVELVANSLDARATQICIDFDPSQKILVVEDNGKGMNASQFDEYHDFAAGLKTRGTGIGFAGLGAKVSFNVADRVITETKSKSLSAGSNWYLQSKKKLIWEDIQPTRLQGSGTRVEVQFRSDTRPSYSSTGDLITLLRRHYLPLLDTKFLNLYENMGLYSRDLTFLVNGRIVKPGKIAEDLYLDEIMEFFPERKKKKFGYGILGVAASEYPIAPDTCGVLLSTYGKVIKAELFNQFPGMLGPRLFGVVEIPEFVNFLTTAKTDFIKKGKHKEFEKLYDPIRQEFKTWLCQIGVESIEIAGTDEATKLERELRKLAEDIPEIGEFFGFWTKKNVLEKDEEGLLSALSQEGAEITFPVGGGQKGEAGGFLDTGDGPGETIVENEGGDEKAKPISRKARRGPKIAFAEAPERVDLAWVEGNNVVINSGHPSYVKTHSNSNARILHNLFAVASAIQRFLGSENATPDLMFIDRMMAAWGQK